MKVLITGAAGYLGEAVIDRLKHEHDLTLADIHPRQDGGRWLRLDVTDPVAVREAVAGQEAVVHMAALVRGRSSAALRDFVDVMVAGTWAVADACGQEGLRKIINISSVAADGFIRGTGHRRKFGDEPAFVPVDLFYAIAKHLGEAVVRAYAHAYDLQAINLRLGVLAGDGENHGPERPAIDLPYWFTYVDRRDVADGVAQALACDVIGTYYLLAGRPDTVWEWEPARRDLGYEPQFNWPEF